MLKKTVISIVVILILMQFIRIDKNNPDIDEKIALQAPKDVMGLLKRSCYDCHSFETKWPYYADIAPVSFFVSSHVKKARKAINFSQYKSIDEKIKVQRLKRAIITVNNGMMALPSYISAHEEAQLNKSEKEILTKWFKEELELLKEKN